MTFFFFSFFPYLLHSCRSVPNSKMCVVNKNNEATSLHIPCMLVFLVLLSCFFQVINKMAIFVESCSFFISI